MNTTLLQQGSAEWLHQRAGKVTSSRVKDVMSFLKNGQPSQKRKDYMIELVCERLTGFAADHYVSPAMEYGSVQEPIARTEYELRTGLDVSLVGLVIHPRIPLFAASPDGRIGDDGLVEFKAPETWTHIEWMLAGVVPPEHEWQMFAQMACEGRAWNEFCSFDGRLSSRHQLFIKRLQRDEQRIKDIEDGVVAFLAEVDEVIARLESLNPEVQRKVLKQQLEDSLDETYLNDSDLPASWREVMEGK